LIWQLQQCNNFVDSEFNSIQFIEEQTKINIIIEENNDFLQSKIILNIQGKKYDSIKFLTEEHVLANHTIFKIYPLSENFNELYLFETRFLPMDLEKYLSLLYSYFENITVIYKNFKVINGPPKETKSTIIFEKIDFDQALHLRVTTSLSSIDLDFFNDYDISRIATVNDLEKNIIIRDVIFNQIDHDLYEIEKILKKYRKDIQCLNNYYIDNNLLIIESSLAKEFIYKELTHLISSFIIYGAENLIDYKVRTVTPKLNLSLSQGIDFLEGDANIEIENQFISLFDALNQFQKNSYIALNDGTYAIINKNYIKKLQRIFKKQRDKVKISFFDLPLVEELIDEKIVRKSFKKSREIFLGFNKLNSSKIKYPYLKEPLRQYQKYGYKWIQYLYKHQLGGCLADDMGLGKTVQAITLLSIIYPKEKISSLIIMPKSLIFNWANEIEKFNSELTYLIYHGPDRNFENANKHHLILSTYATVRNDIQKLKEFKFHYIILDESQNIKNYNSQISKSVMLLQSKYRLALSGTPIENNLSELYSLFRFLNPSMFGSLDDFNKNYLVPIQKGDDKEVLHELKKKIYPFILRRLKKDVLKDLPEKIEQTLFINMTEEQYNFYEQRRLFYYQTIRSHIAQKGIKKSQFFILQALSELRQIASIPESKSDNQILSPKREVLIENILDVIANSHKVLVFTNFLHGIDSICEDLDKHQIKYLVMTGATHNRKELVEQFQNDDSYKVFIMTLKTGGVGLNLTAADYIFIYDPWWNIAAENQAIDRTHRIGQDKTVFSYKLIMKKSIEEKILELQKQKQKLFENLISSDGASIKSLNEQDVEFVLGN
jgi:SNF2 family DNA or RNA helicase